MLEKTVSCASHLYGRIIRVWVLFFPYFAVTYPEDLQLVLSSRKHTEKVFFYKMLHNFLGNGLITSSGKEQEYGVKKKKFESIRSRIGSNFIDKKTCLHWFLMT